jgi:hypothetical protein
MPVTVHLLMLLLLMLPAPADPAAEVAPAVQQHPVQQHPVPVQQAEVLLAKLNSLEERRLAQLSATGKPVAHNTQQGEYCGTPLEKLDTLGRVPHIEEGSGTPDGTELWVL